MGFYPALSFGLKYTFWLLKESVCRFDSLFENGRQLIPEVVAAYFGVSLVRKFWIITRMLRIGIIHLNALNVNTKRHVSRSSVSFELMKMISCPTFDSPMIHLNNVNRDRSSDPKSSGNFS